MEINKIIDNYNKSIQDYKLDQKSKHWKYYYGKKFNNLSEEKIINFRNNGLSDGLDNVRLLNSCEKKYNDFINYAKPLNIFSQNFEKYFPEKNIGNCPNYITRNNAFVDHDVIDSLASLLELKGLIFSKTKIKSVCEIGGGYGSLCSAILKDQNLKYVLVDLPETNILSTYYLSNLFPNKKICTISDLVGNELVKEIYDKYDIFILTPWTKVKSIKFDLFINCRSWMEMKNKVIKEYFKFIENTINEDGFLYNSNRYYKDSVGEKVILSKYPYDHYWKIIYSKMAWEQRRIHTIITQRTNLKMNDINEAMKNIKILEKNHIPPKIPLFLIYFYRKIKSLIKKNKV